LTTNTRVEIELPLIHL